MSRLPAGDDLQFDGEETGDDTDMVCAITVLSRQVKPTDSATFMTESSEDPAISVAMRYSSEGWPIKKKKEDKELTRYRQLQDSLSNAMVA